AVIVDLEDGCRAEQRPAAREHVIAAFRSGTFDPERTIIRVNPAGSEDFAADMAAVAACGARTIMLPKAEGPFFQDAASQPHGAGAPSGGAPAIAPPEPPRGVVSLAAIAAAPSGGALMGGAKALSEPTAATSSRYAAEEKPTPGGAPSGHPGGYGEAP